MLIGSVTVAERLGKILVQCWQVYQQALVHIKSMLAGVGVSFTVKSQILDRFFIWSLTGLVQIVLMLCGNHSGDLSDQVAGVVGVTTQSKLTGGRLQQLNAVNVVVQIFASKTLQVTGQTAVKPAASR